MWGPPAMAGCASTISPPEQRRSSTRVITDQPTSSVTALTASWRQVGAKMVSVCALIDQSRHAKRPCDLFQLCPDLDSHGLHSDLDSHSLSHRHDSVMANVSGEEVWIVDVAVGGSNYRSVPSKFEDNSLRLRWSIWNGSARQRKVSLICYSSPKAKRRFLIRFTR